MELTFAFLADAAQVTPEGKLWVLGGTFEILQSPNFPMMHPAMSVVIKLGASMSDYDAEHQLRVELVDPDGRPLGAPAKTGIRMGLDPIRPGKVICPPIVMNFQSMQFQKPGEYAFLVFMDDARLGSVPVSVIQSPQGFRAV